MNFLDAASVAKLEKEGVLIIDTRPLETIVFDFLEGSLSINWNEEFITTFRRLVGDEQRVAVLASEADAPKIHRAIAASGFKGLSGFFSEVATANLKKSALILIEPDEFAIDFNHDEFYLVDVRSHEDFENEHLEWAENIPVEDIEQVVQEMSNDMRIYVVAENAAAAATAASLFLRNGFHFVRAVAGCYDTFRQLKLPTIKAAKTKLS